MRDTSQQYFYHPDHLGSSSFISDASGEACQFMAYLPYGEQWVDQRNPDSYDAPYKFSGKELDAETGYNYFGARYYDSGLSVWLSVDPLSEERGHTTPYNYCQANPIVRIDEYGALDDWYKNKQGKMKYAEDVHSQDDLQKKGIEGTYIGMSHKESGIYYSFFGQTFNANTQEGQIVEKIDESIINAGKDFQDSRNPTNPYDPEIPQSRRTDFNINLPINTDKFRSSKANLVSFEYAGATIFYNKFLPGSVNIGVWDWFNDNKQTYRGFGSSVLPVGYDARIHSVNSTADIAIIVFPTLILKNSWRNRWKAHFN